jgi:hypothetical protein
VKNRVKTPPPVDLLLKFEKFLKKFIVDGVRFRAVVLTFCNSDMIDMFGML